MLRLNICCSVIPKQVKSGARYGSWITPNHGPRNAYLRISVKALSNEKNGGSSGYSERSWDPGLEIEVPFEQRPEPLRFVLAAGTGTLDCLEDLFGRKDVAYLVVIRKLDVHDEHQGWSYVGDRLLSAVIPYEENGWYDGQMWVKPPEVLARDRLLGSYKVKPVIKLLKQTLVGTGVLLVTAVFLFVFATPVEDFLQNTFTTNEKLSEFQISKGTSKYNKRKEELLRLPVEVMVDDDLATAAAEAADGRPV